MKLYVYSYASVKIYSFFIFQKYYHLHLICKQVKLQPRKQLTDRLTFHHNSLRYDNDIEKGATPSKMQGILEWNVKKNGDTPKD